MGKSKELKVPTIYVLMCYVLFSRYCSAASQYDSETVGKAAKGRLGSLYHLRNKLNRSPVTHPTDAHVDHYASGRRLYSPQKESRGYSFHHSSADITNPMFTQGYTSRDFHSRMGKVSDSTTKWKSPDKNMDKYIKYAYKMDESSWKSGGNSPPLNSFNIHQLDVKGNDSNSKVKAFTSPIHKSSVPTTAETTTSTISSTSTTTKSPFSSSGIDMSPFKAIGQGLNSAMTTVLTQKLMGIIDQEAPIGFLNPLKHLVSSGQRMVEFWDKRANARDGKAPGIVEMFGYGIDQLKKYRDGQQILASDPIANLTSASKTMIQGMVVVKRLTNRVLGYDTDDQAVVESRGGYDHGGGWGWGGGHHMGYGSGLGGLDPFALIAALAFGAFLLQLLLTLINTSQRSLDVVDLNVPLLMSDYHVPNIMTKMDKIFGTPTIRTRRSIEEEIPYFNSIVDKLDVMYKTYKLVSTNPACAKLHACREAIQHPTENDSSRLSQLYTFGLGQLSGDLSFANFLKSIKTRLASGEDVNCETEVKDCQE